MTAHGTLSSYTRSGCRCGECRAASAAYKRAHRERKRALLPTMDQSIHGHPNTYDCFGCRCGPCTIAWREKCAERKERRVPPPLGDPRHGSDNTYNHYGCRCDICMSAHSDRGRAYYNIHRKTARWGPF